MATGNQPLNLDPEFPKQQQPQQQPPARHFSQNVMHQRLPTSNIPAQASQFSITGNTARASQSSLGHGCCVAVPDPSACGHMPQAAQQRSPVESQTTTAHALQPNWMQHGGPLPGYDTEGNGVAPWAAQMRGGMMENVLRGSGYKTFEVRTNFQQDAWPSDLMMVHDNQVQEEQMFRQLMQQAAIRQQKITQGLASEHMAHMEILKDAQVCTESAHYMASLQCTTPMVSHLSVTPLMEREILAPMRQRPRIVGTRCETRDSGTAQASACVETKVKPLCKETPHHAHENGIGKANPSRKESQRHNANDLGQEIASAVASFLSNPEGEWELDDCSGEQSDQGEDQPNLDSSSCDESSNQVEDVSNHIAIEEHTYACPAPAPEAPIKGKMEKASYQDSKGSISILLQNFLPDPQENQCLERGKNLCQKLLTLPLPKSVRANHLPGLCIPITSCIAMLYKEKRKPTVVAVQQKLREQNFDELIVQSLLPICARMPDLYKIWLQKDCQACLLLSNQPLSSANLEDPSEVEAQCTPEFLEALTEVINKKLHPVTSFTAANNAVGPWTSAKSTSSARPVPVAPPGLFHAVGSPPCISISL